jgi:hypothetical protein
MIPFRAEDLVDWSTNANTRLNAAPATYGTTAAVAAQYTAVHDPFITAQDNLAAARAAGNRSASLTALRNAARETLLDFARPLYKQIQANTAVTDAAKIELGVVVPDVQPTPTPPPPFAPGLDVVSVTGRTVRIRLHDSQQPSRRGRPPGVSGAAVVSCVSAEIPTVASDWRWQGNTGTLVADVTFPDTVPAGAQVWIAATWFNDRKEPGPACTPVSTFLQGGAAAAA